MELVKYINNDMSNGIEYDWKKICREYNKLGCPPFVYNPTTAIMSGCQWNVGLSERSTGKTTNWVLVGLVMNAMYGTIFHYIRQTEDMTAPKILGEMMSTINEWGYPKKLTNGKYNTIKYRNRRFYYANIDEDGNEVDKSPTHCGYAMSIDKNFEYKSGYNDGGLGGLIIFDEFISNRYSPNEFVTFCDLLKTIIRNRQDAKIVLVANTINKHNTYLQELCINKEIVKMSIGDAHTYTTTQGTNIYIELIGQKMTRHKLLTNRLYFGFDNPQLNAITGGGTGWAIDNYPHIESDEDRTIIHRHIFVKFNMDYIELELCISPTQGLHVLCHMANPPRHPEECIIYTNRSDDNFLCYRYLFGHTRVDSTIWGLRSRNKWYYSTNEVGEIIKSYCQESRAIHRNI